MSGYWYFESSGDKESSLKDDEEYCYIEEIEEEVALSAEDRLFDALECNDAVAVQRALQDGANVNAVRDYTTPLLEACMHDNAEIVGILLDAGADARRRDSLGSSAITVACNNGDLSTVHLLINHDNSLLEMSTHDGWTPLFQAIRGAHVNVARLLLAAGADVEARDKSQETALHLAARWGIRKVMRELISQHNANMFAVNKNGRTPLDLARRSSMLYSLSEITTTIVGSGLP